MATAGKDGKSQLHELQQIDAGKYVRYTPEQVEALERVYMECPKPSSLRRQQLIRECPILANIEPKQIKVWFQNRRCREKQRKEASRLQTVNRKLTALNKLLMEENDRLQKQVSHLVYENGYMRQQLHVASAATTDNSCESVVTSGQHQQQHNAKLQHFQRDANNPAGLLAIAEETLSEFLSKATGTSVEWVQMVGMKPGPDSIGIIAVSHNCSGVAARACGLVSLEPTKVAEILKARSSWYRDCRCLNVATLIPAGNGGNIELIYMQTYAPTTLAAARDFWTLRYTTGLEDGSLVICERSLTSSTGGPPGPPAPNFVRAEMLSSGYLIRPCEGGGSMIHIVDHVDLDAKSVPEVLRPLYESPKIVAHKMTIAALRHLRQIAHETSGEVVYSGGRQPAVLRTFSQRLSRGFNDAINGFLDDGWSLMSGDGGDDVTITVNSSPSKLLGSVNSSPLFAFGGGILCAKASMLLQNVPSALLVRFLREHRSEWADYGADAYSTASLRASSYPILGVRASGSFHGGQVILPLAQTVENEEFLEVIRLEGHGFSQDDVARDMYLLQLCSGVDENAVGACSQLVFAPIDESFADDAPLLPSGFRVIPLESKTEVHAAARTLDLASALEVGSGGATHPATEGASNMSNLRSVLTIAFQFTYENHFRENMAAMARQYVRSVVASVQRVAMAISPSRIGSLGSKHLTGSPEGLTLARWISRSYKFHTGADLFRSEPDDEPQAGDSLLKLLWHYPDAIMCCTVKSSPVFTFANQAGLDMLETTLIALQDITLEKILDDNGRKVFCTEFSKIMQQGFAYLPGGVCLSSMGRPASYDQVIVWKVIDEEDTHHCLAFMFLNWSFV
ncbi:homeobox-leucine zipper protein HOX32 [Dendrobium catenatum]|uniref:homeobox-leucine zipper protein HOX32 n=1 Tax=Dendrobium catenatum TaxID=906689 RepID=UPI0009F3069F|nr:homeobox-leucine zipper protein HOX32 [Dendrobium catenatum]XP_020698924.1 homeobox-leucine zipper protein HOX32 [Dendrobium catenatum]